MRRDLYCPLCGELQKQVNLEETENHFICDKCEAEIVVTELKSSKEEFGFRVVATKNIKQD